MICNGAPPPVWPVLEQYNQWYRWNLAMIYAGCVISGGPTAFLTPWNEFANSHSA